MKQFVLFVWFFLYRQYLVGESNASQILNIADVSHFQKLKEETSFDFDIHWNSEPSAIGKST